MTPHLLVCTSLLAGGEAMAEPAAVAVAVAFATAVSGGGDGALERAPLVLDLRRRPRAPRGAVLASRPARSVEAGLAGHPGLRAAARGRLCFAAAPAAEESGGTAAEPVESLLADVVHGELETPLVVALCEPPAFRPLLAVGEPGRRAALVHAGGGPERALLSQLCFELSREAVPVKVWDRPVGAIATRRALAGLEAGGDTGTRAARVASLLGRRPARASSRRIPGLGPALGGEAGQGLPAMLGLLFVVLVAGLALLAIGAATTAKARFQRAADLAAVSAARSMHDDFPRLFLPPRLPNGAPNPAHLPKSEYMARARAAAEETVERNDAEDAASKLRFPDAASFAPLRVRVVLSGEIGLEGERRTGKRASVRAEAEIAPLPSVPGPAGGNGPAVAAGGGYSGPLEYRQGKPMRPDVAAAFDRMAAVAAAAGVTLTVTSGFRSDAEQQALWDANPDPQWVARPGTSLHRCGTELDLGPASAYGWLAANAPRFGFLKRYGWEPWHFGYVRGPEPCSAEGDRVGRGAAADGRGGGQAGLPGFVPARYRRPLLAAAMRHNVSAALLAAQLMAESNFNPNAVSSAGAQGIAQFMPGTAAAYGLDDPFDPVAAIDAQARMMAELLGQFGSVELALAAYNAGPGAVSPCDCIPPYPETQAYVAKILGLLKGAGDLLTPAPSFEVRLVD